MSNNKIVNYAALQNMSKAGLKLGSGLANKSLSHNEDFDNEFLENEEQAQQKQCQEQKISPINNKSISHSQYLPVNSTENIGKDSQAKIIKRLNNGMEKLSVSILQMRQNCKDLDIEEILFKKRNLKKQQQIQKFLAEMKAEKVKRNQKKKKRLQRQAKSLQESINLEQQKKKQRRSNVIQQSLDKLKQLKKSKQFQKQQKIDNQKKISQIYAKIKVFQKDKPKFYLRKIEEDKKININQLEEQKKILAKRRQNFKPLDMAELQEHSRRYQQLLNQLESVKRAQKQQQYLKILEHNKKLQQFYRGRVYDNVVQQRQERKNKKSEPMEKHKKMKNYQDYVRQNFVPKMHQKQQQSDPIRQKHSSQSHREVKRYRYLQGVSYGQIVENRPIARTEAQQRKMGNQYMAFMRSLPKRKIDHNDHSINSAQDNASIQMKLLPKKPNPLAQHRHKESVEVKISDKPTRDELGMIINQLKNKDTKIQRYQKVIRHSSEHASPNISNKQIGEDLVFNIQRKLNLLSKL